MRSSNRVRVLRPLPPIKAKPLATNQAITVIQGPSAEKVAKELDGIAIAPGRSADEYRWMGVRGRRVHLIEQGEVDDDRVRATAIALLTAGAVHVFVTRTELVGQAYTRGYLPRRHKTNVR